MLYELRDSISEWLNEDGDINLPRSIIWCTDGVNQFFCNQILFFTFTFVPVADSMFRFWCWALFLYLDLKGSHLEYFVHSFSAVHVNIQEYSSRAQDNIFLGTCWHILVGCFYLNLLSWKQLLQQAGLIVHFSEQPCDIADRVMHFLQCLWKKMVRMSVILLYIALI